MTEKLYPKMHSFVTERFDLTRVANMLRDNSSSHLLEITGKSGSGKSYLVNTLSESLHEAYETVHFFSPNPLYFNQFPEALQLLCDIGNETFSSLLEEHKTKFSTGMKYDFFYFLTEQLQKLDLLKPRVLIIDDGDVLDQYTKDFLQYLVQYAEDTGIQIVFFSQERNFPFSRVEYINPLTSEDINRLLQMIFGKNGESYDKESEIIHKISDGNLLIVEKILSDMLEKKPKGGFDLSPFLDRTFDPLEIYRETLSGLSASHKNLLLYLLIMDNAASDEHLKTLGLEKNHKKDIDDLVNSGLLGFVGSRYIVQKKRFLLNCIKEEPEQFMTPFLNNIIKLLEENDMHRQTQARVMMFKKKYKASFFDDLNSELELLSDNENLLRLREYQVKHTRKPAKLLKLHKQIAIANSKMNKNDEAVNHLRQCLHISSEKDIRVEETVYLLANNLFTVNSVAFALEIIKKYSPITMDPFWKVKIQLLKADIMTESEKYQEALEILGEIIHMVGAIEIKNMRYIMQGEAKKIKGKIHYYINEWDQAEQAFQEAETFYEMAGDHKGLAAAYNNLAVLYMFQGDWDKSEQFFLRSLKLERENYNLNGVSVCYNNLGGLMDDKGDPQKSLMYLEEALKLQKMLNEPYNITNIYNNIGVTWMDHSEFDKAEDALKKSLQTAMDFGFFRNTIASLNNLGALYFKKGDWDQAISYHEQAIKKCEDNDFTEGLLRSFNNLGEVYEKQDELNLAYDLYFKGYELLPTVSDEYIKAELYGNIGSVLTKLHKFKDAYSYLVESLDFFKSINARDKVIEGYQKQAYYFILTRNYESADYYLTQAMNMATEQKRQFEIGKIYYLRALLERKNLEAAKEHLSKAIEHFVETSNYYDLSLANYALAEVLFDLEEWENAIQILKNNKKIIRSYGSIKLLEQNDILTQKISREYSRQMKDVKFEENLLNQFYEITQNLNTITDVDVLMEQSLEGLVEISEADGGILCLHGSANIPDSWDYKLFNNFSPEEKYYDALMNLCSEVYRSNTLENHKQPHFAPSYNNILVIPLSIRKDVMGVVLLFSKSGSHYFSERIINLLSSLCNQAIVIIENIR
ncbi:MAG: tetratricopeptide repeat protein, partial [Candidatus Syntrophosphaera sp.]